MRTFLQKPTQEAKPVSPARPGRAPSAQGCELSSILDSRRTTGNHAVERPLQANAQEFEDGPRTNALPGLGHDFGRILVHPSPRTGIQPKLKVNTQGDVYEQEADRVAEQTMYMPEPRLQSDCACGGGCPKCNNKEGGHEASQSKRVQAYDDGETIAPFTAQEGTSSSSGQPLNSTTREFMESRFGVDFGHVRVHTDGEAAHVCRSLNAQAFTHHQHIYFGAGKSPGNDELTAHELTHVVQQTIRPQAAISTANGIQTKLGQAPDIQRKLELRPPGRGEASAFGRAQELVDRLNTISPAIQYELKGQQLVYTVKDATALTHFDTVMKGFIDRAELVPMRLITSKGYVGGGPLFADSFITGYVDLDDLLADDIYSFQSDLLHFLTERFQVKDYARRIGTNFSAQFPKAHRAGKDAEAAQLQDLFNDPSIVFVYEELKPNNTWVNAFKSKDHGYWVFQVVRQSNREVAGGEMWVRKRDGTRVTVDDFRKERAAAAP